MEHHIRLAQQLHPRLLRFFAKHPPLQIAASTPSTPAPQQSETITIAPNTSSSDPNIGAATTEILAQQPARNPFLPFRNPRTGNWQSPQISLRRQAELFKLARAYDVLPLMPISPKHPEVKEQKRIENGLRVQGTGVGKKVKGKAWERTMRGRLEERRRAMEGMPEMIREWKERGHGRGLPKAKWPK
ncbi:hypothetical protein DOTSEDRAFT_160054 [Dothistroma septosporum NZE10]|uniref:Large ribosomal subunit protein mL59 domain-containing protein n=1 Tax=Dothistroma septosporum (strain NZE10 / CBS 128990) TaxID=675120 RepID=M2YL95_DOTSN|nr:hypothetical protein DOTSEDRAFT_160054 [Dothistroma septosporum NZE10]